MKALEPICSYCKKKIDNLWKYDGKVIKCPHCGKYLRVCSVTCNFTLGVQLEESDLKYYKSLDLISEYKKEA